VHYYAAFAGGKMQHNLIIFIRYLVTSALGAGSPSYSAMRLFKFIWYNIQLKYGDLH